MTSLVAKLTVWALLSAIGTALPIEDGDLTEDERLADLQIATLARQSEAETANAARFDDEPLDDEQFDVDELQVRAETEVPTMADVTLAPTPPPTNDTFEATGAPVDDSEGAIVDGKPAWAYKMMECDQDGLLAGFPTWETSADACVGKCAENDLCTHVNVEKWPVPPSTARPIKCHAFNGPREILGDGGWTWLARPIPTPTYEKKDEYNCYVKAPPEQIMQLTAASASASGDGASTPSGSAKKSSGGVHPGQIAAIFITLLAAVAAVIFVVHRKRAARNG